MFVLINLKAYAVTPSDIAKAAASITQATTAEVAIAPQSAAIAEVAEILPTTYAQHVSEYNAGSHTGSTLAEAVSEAGAIGTILNHSERRLTLAQIDAGIQAAHRANLEVIVCANSPPQVAAVTALEPDMVAVEPPALIGSGTPVSRADPDIVRDAVSAAHRVNPDVPVLCGAGISTGEDVVAAEELGAEGVLLASGVAKAADPEKALRDLVAPYATT